MALNKGILICAGLTCFCLLAAVTVAMPPHPEIKDKIDRGEVHVPVMKSGTENISTPGLNAPSPKRSPQVAGPFRALCILVDFGDKIAQANRYDFDTLIFVNQSGTVRDYYNEVSYGQIDMVTVNLPSALNWKRAPQTYAYYVDNNYGIQSPYPHNSQKLCEDLVDLVDGSVDFSQYDNNGDGYVDVIMVVHAGPGAEFTGQTTDIWSHKWSVSPRLKDGVYVMDYTVMPEYWSAPGDMTIGVFCHELGHAFGLPDLYDTDGSSYGTGAWSLMSSGSWNGGLGQRPAHPDAWCKSQVGWLTPTNISSNQSGVSIPQVETNQSVYRLWTGGGFGNEYYLVENRQRVGYDQALPSSGLLIWHIDENASSNDNEWYPGHTTFGHYNVALEQADNLFNLEKRQGIGDGGDPFPGSGNNTTFSPVSVPSSDSYGSSSTFVAITNISPSGSTMTADMSVSLTSGSDDEIAPPLPQFVLGQNYPNPFNPITSFRYTLPSSGQIAITIYNLLGESVRKLYSGYHSSGEFESSWDGTDNGGARVASGIYLYELAAQEARIVNKMVLMK